MSAAADTVWHPRQATHTLRVVVTASLVLWSGLQIRDLEAATVARAASDAVFAEELEALAARCDALELPAQARATRDWLIDRDPGRRYLFVAAEAGAPQPVAIEPPIVAKWREHFMRCRREQADRLFGLAKRQLNSGHAAAAYTLIHEVLHEDPDHAESRAILGYRASGDRWLRPGGTLRQRSGRATHPKFGWRRGTYWQIESPHFRITTNHSPKMGTALAERLERFQSVWRQVFFESWSTRAALADRVAGGRSSLGTSRKHEVVLFKDRQEYIEKLAGVGPQIRSSLGYYAKDERISLFYAGEERTIPTWFHEITHQLFQEAGEAVSDVGEKWNFWIVEGIAVYLESLVQHDGYYTLGGFDADRLQYDRWRTLRGEPCMPLAELVELGQNDLQQHPEIRRLYTRAAAYAHFLMDGQQATYRDALLRYLQAVYLGRDTTRTLAVSLGTTYEAVDKQFSAFLAVTDDDLRRLNPPQHVHNLSLGMTQVTDDGMQNLRTLVKLHWLDLAFTKVSDVGVSQLGDLHAMRRLSLEGTRISDASLSVVSQMAALQELDLAHTAVTDRGIAELERLPELTTLYLTKTKITDASIRHLSKLKQLEILDVEETGISAAGVARLRASLPRLRSE